jgi:enoyl-CoA hydratase/carnithine racemase
MAGPQFQTLTLDVVDRIATITLNRPDKMNAFTGQMMLDLVAAFDATDADDAVGAVIVTGAGRAFCAGADLSAGAATFDYDRRLEREPERAASAQERLRDGGGRVTLRIFESLKPVIAAVNGPAVGVGATMQLPMDVRLASTDAKFGFVFARRGIVPEAASSWFLPRVVGVSTALEWCYSGRVFSAAEAKERGLVRSLHAPDELLPAARAIAKEIVDNTAPVSVALTRQMLWRMLGADHPMEAHKIDSRAVYARGQSADAREGVMSFLEKRAPVYPCTVSADMPDFYPWWPERPFA